MENKLTYSKKNHLLKTLKMNLDFIKQMSLNKIYQKWNLKTLMI